ncbi:MAG: sodium:solute symporter family transporter [Gammaproteobacteria bacterium WSBS_2016_MAG_OTU1]
MFSTSLVSVEIVLAIATAILFVVSFAAVRNSSHNEGFYLGLSASGAPPRLLTLVLSQVTTWIFARSLLNAAILGFYYGIWGTLAYSVYYLSFLTGGLIVDSLRFRHGATSVQSFLSDRFGGSGVRCYNFVIGVRLISEVFANLLVIGVLFGAAGSFSYTVTIVIFALVTLGYAAVGGLRASLNTDSVQMALFVITLTLLAGIMFEHEQFMAQTLFFKSFEWDSPGVVLIAVAFMQIWSYPMHDPVMMDRGFLSDRKTTRRSFIHAGWLSFVCIFLFGLLGVFAGASAEEGEDMRAALTRLLGEWPMLLFSLSLIISAMSTLDSTLSSSAKLVVVDMKKLPKTLASGRAVMALFMLAGLLMVFLGSKDLFSAVAVSGTASMYLAPVIFFCLWGNVKNIPQWSYLTSFIIAMIGAALYFTETAGYSDLITPLFGIEHKYTKLLLICTVVLSVGCGSFAVGKFIEDKRLVRA